MISHVLVDSIVPISLSIASHHSLEYFTLFYDLWIGVFVILLMKERYGDKSLE